MEGSRTGLAGMARGMSARLLVLTVAFVMLAEVLVYVPSISRFRLVYLESRIETGYLASLALKATPDNMVSQALENELLANAKVRGVVAKQPDRRTLMLSEDMPPSVDASFDLRNPTVPELIGDALMTFLHGHRVIRAIGPLPDGMPGSLEVVMDEAPLHAAMVGYSTNILQLSIIISLITASLVYLALHVLMVRPMLRITEAMTRFRKAPEDETSVIAASGRGDEIGMAERELQHMQNELRHALRQRARLAALGAAVSKINHDLRNILATAQLVSDSLSGVEDDRVRRIAPRLMKTIDRAIDLCTQTLNFGRAEEEAPRRGRFPLAELVDEVAASLGLPADAGPAWTNDIPPGLTLEADREQMFRVLLNLGRNAVQAMPEGGEVRVSAEDAADEGIAIEVADTGPGLPAKAREHLFEPFTGSARRGGTGLGLTIARELVEGHGGRLLLARSDAAGTTFRIELPPAPRGNGGTGGNGEQGAAP
ncbi:MAG TPA: HAMP domain-containing sensor histidine kinase [Alphaproteobacteria bacterium]|nr:HAMP domain-containing sensor histidine kinase [Alphaproteobacteria bacterium]